MQQEKLRLIEGIQDMYISIGEIEYDLQDQLQYGLEQEIYHLNLMLQDEINTLEFLQLQYLQLTGREFNICETNAHYINGR